MKYTFLMLSMLGASTLVTPALAQADAEAEESLEAQPPHPVVHAWWRCTAISTRPHGGPRLFVGRGPARPIAVRDALRQCQIHGGFIPAACRILTCNASVMH